MQFIYQWFQFGADRRLMDLSSVYRQGQTVVAMVVEINEEKQRLLASLRMQDCYHGDTETGLQMTVTFLQTRQRVIDMYTQSTGIVY